MKREVFLIGPDLRAVMPFSLAFPGPEYSVTMIETTDVIGRAVALAATHETWFVLVAGDASDAECARLTMKAPNIFLLVDEGEDPLVVLAHFIALTTWDEVAPQTPAEPLPQTREQHG